MRVVVSAISLDHPVVFLQSQSLSAIFTFTAVFVFGQQYPRFDLQMLKIAIRLIIHQNAFQQFAVNHAAGAGKTTTVAAKVKYPVEKQQVDPKQILIISFTNKAVNELRDKINKDLNIDCPIATFHSTGNAILHKNNPEKNEYYRRQ